MSTLQVDNTVENANQIMDEKGETAIPIFAEGKVTGIVTMSDVERIPKERAASTKVSEIMTRNVISVGPFDNLFEAFEKMTTNSISRLPVIDQETGMLTGLITPADIFRAYDMFVSNTKAIDRKKVDK